MIRRLARELLFVILFVQELIEKRRQRSHPYEAPVSREEFQALMSDGEWNEIERRVLQ